eukprot:jgi/Psemu1/33247/gm1.33247_g
MTSSLYITPLAPLPNNVSSGYLPMTGATSQMSTVTGSAAVEITVVTNTPNNGNGNNNSNSNSNSNGNGIRDTAFLHRTTTVQRKYKVRLNIPLSSSSAQIESLNVKICQHVPVPSTQPVAAAILPHFVASDANATTTTTATAAASGATRTADPNPTTPFSQADASPSLQSQLQRFEQYTQLKMRQWQRKRQCLFQQIQKQNSIQQHKQQHHHQQQQQQQQQQTYSQQILQNSIPDGVASSVSLKSLPEIVSSSSFALHGMQRRGAPDIDLQGVRGERPANDSPEPSSPKLIDRGTEETYRPTNGDDSKNSASHSNSKRDSKKSPIGNTIELPFANSWNAKQKPKQKQPIIEQEPAVTSISFLTPLCTFCTTQKKLNWKYYRTSGRAISKAGARSTKAALLSPAAPPSMRIGERNLD